MPASASGHHALDVPDPDAKPPTETMARKRVQFVIERTVPAVWVLAATCWIVGGGLLVMADLVLGPWAAHVGIIGLAGGMTLSIKGFFNRLWQCEITAFRLGEQAERERHLDIAPRR